MVFADEVLELRQQSPLSVSWFASLTNGMLEYWNYGMLGPKEMGLWFVGKITLI